jgi:hypothetical protein
MVLKHISDSFEMLLKTVPAISIILCEHIENWYENSIFFIYAAVVPWMENLSIFNSVDPLPPQISTDSSFTSCIWLPTYPCFER